MGFWESLKGQVLAAPGQVFNAAYWFWQNTSPLKIGKAVAHNRFTTFFFHTGIHLFENVAALRQAIPTLAHNPQAKVVTQSMANLLIQDLAPVITLHALTNRIEDFIINQEDNQDHLTSMCAMTLLLCSYLMIVDYNNRRHLGSASSQVSLLENAQRAMLREVLPYVAIHLSAKHLDSYLANQAAAHEYWLWQCSYSSLRILPNTTVNLYEFIKILPGTVRDNVISTFSPAAFNSNKTLTPASECNNKCNMQRKVKGMGREVGILAANEALIWILSQIPYTSSPYFITALTVFNNGRFVVRAVTPERCERHKNMKQEFVLAMGLSHWAMTEALFRFTSYTGPLPAPYLRIFQHLVLQMQVNLAAHMDVPSIAPKDATIRDLFNDYEAIWRFIFDVVWSGLLIEIPRRFIRPGQPPLITFSGASKALVHVLESNLEKLAEHRDVSSTDSTLKRLKAPNPLIKKLKDWLLPPMFRSSYDVMRDEVIAAYWKDIRANGLEVFTAIEGYKESTVVSVLAWWPEKTAELLECEFAIPAKLTKIILMLSKEEDFWALRRALHAFFERLGVTPEERLVRPKQPLLALRDDSSVRLLPEKPAVEVASAAQLVAAKPHAERSAVVDAQQLMPTNDFGRLQPSIVHNPETLFTAVPRKRNKALAFDMLLAKEPNKGVGLGL